MTERPVTARSVNRPAHALDDAMHDAPRGSRRDVPRDPSSDPAASPDVPSVAPSGRRPPRPKRKQPGPYRVVPREKRHGLLIVNTGDGKGKTTAALGVLLRAVGRGMTVGMFQFIKHIGAAYGEHLAARRLGMAITPLGDGFTWLSENIADDRALAEAGWARCREALASGRYDVLIFDELTYPLIYGWLDPAVVLDAIHARPVGTHVIITGRNAPQALIDAADLVTEMRLVKHPYRDQGLGAQPGIDL